MIEKIKSSLKKEALIFILMLLLLAVISHGDLLTNPAARFELMNEKENYFHPLLYTFILYAILFIIRKVLDFILGLFEKK